MTTLKFMNSSVTSADLSLGWNNQESRVTINLADDPSDDDYFTPNDPGVPAIFSCGSLSFVGLMESWTRDDSLSGFPLYSVNLVDPRVLFDGVNIVLDTYYGKTYTNNTFNVFGYYENQGFGKSQRNESGIPWKKIVSGINDIQNSPGDYGKKISYRGISYYLDLSGLPQLPDYYRVSGDPSISLMQFINDICETANCDFIIDLNSNLMISIITVSRNSPVIRGQLSRYIANTELVSSRSFGEEMVNETCCKMVVGGKKNAIFPITKSPGPDFDYEKREDNTIEQYWGVRENGSAIIPFGKNGAFQLDSKNVIAGKVGEVYNTDVGEIRASLDSQSSWESYLWLMCMYEYYPDQNGDSTDYVYEVVMLNNAPVFQKTNVTYSHSGEENPHFRKAFDLDLKSSTDINITKFLLNSTPQQILSTNLLNLERLTFKNAQNPEEDVSDRLYKYVRSYAEEYYGRKYMVIVPNVKVAIDKEFGDIYLSHSPTSSAYLNPELFNSAIYSRLLPREVFKLQDEDNRLYPYVRFNNSQPDKICSFENISNDDVLYGIDYNKNAGTLNGSVFIKCDIEDYYVYLDGSSFTSPRVIITLPNRITEFKDSEKRNTIISEYLELISTQKNWTKGEKSSIIDKFLKSNITTFLSLRTTQEAITPNLAGVPLESQTETYGPWYSNIADGRCELEIAEDLVPWNFLNYDKMNEAGLARVNEIVGTLQFAESGTIESPGYPSINLGAALISGGPQVTGISIQASTGGITTTYTMRTWTPSFGKLSRYNQERIQKIDSFAMRIDRKMRERIKNQFRKVVGQ